jgi:hypothetical protein
MSTNENFKYDVRVRERMVSKGLLTPDAVKAYLDGLKDVESESRPIGVPQPALSADVDLDDEDDEEDDEDEDEES